MPLQHFLIFDSTFDFRAYYTRFWTSHTHVLFHIYTLHTTKYHLLNVCNYKNYFQLIAYSSYTNARSALYTIYRSFVLQLNNIFYCTSACSLRLWIHTVLLMLLDKVYRTIHPSIHMCCWSIKVFIFMLQQEQKKVQSKLIFSPSIHFPSRKCNIKATCKTIYELQSY